jgi:hypothetical protein
VISATAPVNTGVLWVDTTQIASNTLIGNAAGNIDMAGFSLQLDRFAETTHNMGNVTGTITPDAVNGTIQTMTLTGNITFNTVSNMLTGGSATFVLIQDATGGRTLTSNMRFAAGDRTLSTAANSRDIVSVFFDGATYYATLSKGYV